MVVIYIPVMNGSDSNGRFYRWGKSGKKYYYTPNDNQSRERAKEKQRKQGVAIKISQNKDN